MALRGLLLILFVLWLIPPSVMGQMDINDRYDRLTTYDGLSSNVVLCTVEDKQGYIWIATNNGLDRYDGKNIKQFNPIENDETSLISKSVVSLLLDNKDRLWVTTRDGLCYKYDGDKFYRFLTDPTDNTAIPHNNVTSTLQDSKGRIWIGTQNGLCLYNEQNKNFTVFQYDKADNISKGFNSVGNIFEDSKGNIWVSTWTGGISIIDERNPRRITFNRLNLGSKHEIEAGCFLDFFEDETGRIWAHENFGRLVQVKWDQKKNIVDCTPDDIEFITYDLEDEIGTDRIHTHKFIENKYLLLATDKGIKTISHEAFDSDNETDLKAYYKDFEVRFTFNSCANIRIDDKGIIWISSSNGLFKSLGNTKGIIAPILNQFTEANDLEIFALLVDNGDQDIWIGTDKGLFKFDKTLESHITINWNFNTISTLYQDQEDNIWVGCFNGDLFSIENEKITEYTFHSNKEFDSRSIIWDIDVIDNKIWLGTDKGLVVYDPSTEILQKLPANDIEGLSVGQVFDIIQDNQGSIWASHMGIGMFKVFFNENGVLNYDEDFTRVDNSLILDMELVGDDIWLATVGGIEGYSISRDSFYDNKFLNENVSETIIAISHDENDNLWFSSNDGLTYYNTQTQELATFNSFDGIASNLALKCQDIDREQNIYFGGKKGVNVFKPQDLLKRDTLDKINLTNLTINGLSIVKDKKDELLGEPILNKNIEFTESIALTQDHRNIRFDFSIPDYFNPYAYRFSYKIDNLSSEWIDLKSNFIEVTNFEKGDYTLHIKASDNKGSIYKTKTLHISVLPYVWQKLWFILGSIFLGLLAFIMIIKLRERRSKALRKQLESEVQSRTMEIKDKTVELEYKSNELEDKNEKLLKYIDSNMELEHFAHAVAHDLKSPLITISSFTKLLKRNLASNSESKELTYIDFIEKGSKRSISLIEDILSYSKINSEKLNLEQIDPTQMVQQVLEQIEIAIKESGAVVNINSNVELVKCDSLKIARVIQNLVSNSIKFIPNDRDPVINISIKSAKHGSTFVVKDNGIGISIEDQKVVFDVFKRVANVDAYDGTGMGLAMCKKIVELHGGTIRIDSEKGKGSTFTFTIPHEPISVLQLA